MHKPLIFTYLSLLGSLVKGQTLDATNCGLLGSVYPIPANYESLNAIQNAQNDWTRALNESFQQSKTAWGPVDPTNASISIGVFSTQSDKLLAEFHHVPTRPELRSHLTGSKLDGNSLYRIGSVTKLLSAYAALSKLQNEHWSKPVTNFIPELERVADANPVHSFNWSAITLANLVNHMAGLPRDYSLTDLSSTPDSVPPFFPALNDAAVVECGGPGQATCSREDSLRMMLEQNPLAPSWHTPVYSNNGYELLGLALENITGESFGDTFKTSLVEPLNLTRTFLKVPEPASDLNAVLYEAQEGNWLNDLGLVDPAGAAWSSLYDLSTIGRSILSSSILPPHVQRQWLRPETHTDHPASSVGKAWEIFRMHIPIEPDSNETRLTDLYTKNGGLVGYNAEIVLAPDHGIGFVVLVATLDATDPMPDDAHTLWSLVELATSIWVPAAEAAAREAAAANYTGTFASEDGLNSTIALAVTPDRRGLDITRLVYNSTDYLAYTAETMGRAGGQLQYMGLRGNGQLTFRAVWQQAKRPFGGPTPVFLQDCAGTWTAVDAVKYGGFGDDEFIISVDKDGRTVGVEMPFFRTEFSKRMDRRE